jgi:hypothetical protein
MSKWDEIEREASQANREIRGWWASRSEKQRRVIRVVLVLAALAILAVVAR